MNEPRFFSGWRLGVTIIDKELGLIRSQLEQVHQDVSKTIWNGVMNTHEKLVREKLIELGWTPPPNGPPRSEEMLTSEKEYCSEPGCTMCDTPSPQGHSRTKCQHDYSKPTTTLIVRPQDTTKADCYECKSEFPATYR